MSLLRETTKVFMYILAATILTLSQVYADACSDAFLNLESDIKPLMNKRMTSYDDMYFFSISIDHYRERVKNKPCPPVVLSKIATYRNEIKEKRLATITKFIKLGIKEEAGRDLNLEADYLTGKNPRAQYEFAGAFRPEPIVENRPDTKPPVETIVINPPRVEPVIVTPPRVEPPAQVSDPTCGEVLHQNETVNLQNARNQDSVGWCYAYTAADMLSFKLNRKVSAISLIDPPDIEADVAIGAKPIGGIIEGSARKYLTKNRGVCLEENLPSSDFKFCIDQRYQDYINYLLDLARTNRFDQALSTNSCLERDLRSLFPNVSIPQIQSHIRQKGSKKLIEMLNELQCSRLTSVNPQTLEMETHNSFVLSKTDLMKHLDREISRGVVGIGYDYKTVSVGSTEGGHASLVVGRRVNPANGSCEYLVRNSWGKACEQKEDSEVTCHKNCDSTGCRYSGHFWVSRSRLTSAIADVNYFKR